MGWGGRRWHRCSGLSGSGGHSLPGPLSSGHRRLLWARAGRAASDLVNGGNRGWLWTQCLDSPRARRPPGLRRALIRARRQGDLGLCLASSQGRRGGRSVGPPGHKGASQRCPDIPVGTHHCPAGRLPLGTPGDEGALRGHGKWSAHSWLRRGLAGVPEAEGWALAPPGVSASSPPRVPGLCPWQLQSPPQWPRPHL